MVDRQRLVTQEVGETHRRMARPVLARIPDTRSDGRRPRLGLSHPRDDGSYRSTIQWFEEIRARLSAALGDVAAASEHVGSTAVAGLIAKPEIGVDVVVASTDGVTRRSRESRLQATSIAATSGSRGARRFSGWRTRGLIMSTLS